MKIFTQYILFTCLIVLLQANFYAQNGNSVYNDTVLHTIEITIDLPDWITTLNSDYDLNASNPDLYPEVYRNCNVKIDGTLMNNCGFREKGNASNTFTVVGKKKPFKIAFDAFDNNQTYDGLKKINLSNFTNDPSLLHDAICFKLFRDAGIICSRTSYAKLFVNDEYIGVYLMTENVDKTFLKMHFGSANNDGNLYKTDRGAQMHLTWLGSDKQAYKDKKFKLNTNEDIDDWTGFINFVDFINHYSDNDFKQQFEQRFDVHQYIKILAIEKMVRSWDSYWGGGNNFYLYEHPDGKMRWFPWDMNETFQDVKVLSGTSLLDGYLIPANKFDERPLLKRIFEIPEYKEEYLKYSCELINTIFRLPHLGPKVLSWHKLIDRAYYDDVYRYNAYESFQKTLTDESPDEVNLTNLGYVLRIRYPGIFPFIEMQRKWADKQIEGWKINECYLENNQLYTLDVFPNPCSNFINIKSYNGEFEYAKIKLFDAKGLLKWESDFQVMPSPYYTFNLPNVEPGFYLLIKQSADGKIGRGKLIIE